MPEGNPITPAGLTALKARYDHLLGTERPEIVAIVSWAAGNGDRSENGDPRTGAVGWVEWIEKIPFFETKNYVTRVVENAVVYEALYPDLAPMGRSRGVEDFLR